MMKTVSKLPLEEIPYRYGMNFNEYMVLVSKIKTGNSEEIQEAILTAFTYGYILGARAERAGANLKKL